MQEVLDRRSLPQELRIRHYGEFDVLAEVVADDVRDPVSRSDGGRALVYYDEGALHHLSNPLGCHLYIVEIRFALLA